MTSPAARRRSQFIDAVIDDYAAAHSTPPDGHQLELQRITREKTGRAAGMQIGDDQAVLMEMANVMIRSGPTSAQIGYFSTGSELGRLQSVTQEAERLGYCRLSGRQERQ